MMMMVVVVVVDEHYARRGGTEYLQGKRGATPIDPGYVYPMLLIIHGEGESRQKKCCYYFPCHHPYRARKGGPGGLRCVCA